MVVSDTQKQILKLRKEIKKCACEKKEKQLKSLIEKNKKELAEKNKPKLVRKGKAKLTKEQKEKLRAKKGNTFQDKEKEIKKLFTKALSPELKKAYQSKDTNKMKKEYKKAVNILAEYLGKTGFATNVSQARRTINGGSVGRLIKSFGEGKKLKEPYIFRKVDLSDVYNR